MTEKQLKAKEKELQEAGYRRFTNDRPSAAVGHHIHEWSKNWKDNDDETLYFIMWLVYDHTPYANYDPSIKKNPYGMEVKIYVAHGVELHLWHLEDYNIPTVEAAAKDLYELITKYKFNEEE